MIYRETASFIQHIRLIRTGRRVQRHMLFSPLKIKEKPEYWII